MKKTLKYVLAATVLVTSLGALASCGGGGKPSEGKTYTYNTYTSVSPSNWNELTYQDANDTQIMSYISSSFFGYDFKFDKNGDIVPGEFEVVYQGATKLEDITADYAGDANYAVPTGATRNYAYRITLRDDLKWDDGTPIKAQDFVYTMKQQLDPLFKNYRADSFYNGSTVIHNAKSYVYQGSTEATTARDFHSTWEEAKTDADLYFSLGSASGVGSFISSSYGSYLQTGYTPAWVVVALGCEVSEEELLALEGKKWSEIEASSTLKATWEKVLGWWQTLPNEELDFFVKDYTYPEVSFDSVGIKAESDTELVLVLDIPLELLKEDGSLSYKAAYNMASLPLVKESLYEANKVKPVTGSTLWTSTYNSSVASTASWGPYKLTKFQSGKEYVLERNENWYGYGLEENEKKYQTDRIVCKTIKEWNTAWLAFQNGEIDSIGIDVSISQDYKNSSQAVFTPDDFVGSLQLQSDKGALKKRESAGVNKTILSYVDFRKAISLAIDRDAYTSTCTTASKAGYGLFNSMHYYDVENGGVYRNTDAARQTLCDVYGVDASKFDSLEEAEASITGYDPQQAKTLVTKAYEEALKAGDIKEGDKVVLTFGTGAINESTTRAYEFLAQELKDMVVGTPLEGKLETQFEDHGAKWAEDFRGGAYDICTGGWSGAAWDPGYFLLAYLSPDYMYSTAWDTSSTEMTYTVVGGGAGGSDVTETMSLMDWYNCLNGAAGAKYNWAEGAVANSVRLGIIAALEKEVLSVYYTVPLQNSYSATLISYKSDYITRDYNTFMGYGGIEYLTYAYDDEAWANYLKNNELDYKS